MTRIPHLLLPVLALAFGAALATAAEAQTHEGLRCCFDGGSRSRTFLGLLSIEQVQQELKLSEESVAKIADIREKLAAEMREKFAALRELDDRKHRRAKTAELTGEYNQESLTRLQAVLSPEQMLRLFQIVIQARPVTDSLTHTFIAGRLQLTDEQKTKLTRIVEDSEARRSDLFGGVPGAREKRRGEAFAKLREIREGADEKALGVLTVEQRDIFEKMKGEKFARPRQPGDHRPDGAGGLRGRSAGVPGSSSRDGPGCHPKRQHPPRWRGASYPPVPSCDAVTR